MKLAQLMELLETTHALRQVEISKLEETILAIQTDKDSQIRALKREIASLRGLTGGGQPVDEL